MKNPAQLLRRLRALFHRDALDREMDEEMRFHLEMQARENKDAGVPGKEAEHLARRQFGHVDSAKEAIRDRRSFALWEIVLREVRLSVRSLRRTPLYTAFVVAILAVSIGLTTAIVNVSRAVLLPDFPFPSAKELIVLHERPSNAPEGSYTSLQPERFANYADHASCFTALGGELTTRMNLVQGGYPQRCEVSLVSPGYFPALGISCSRGRIFLPDEHHAADTGSVAILTHEGWTRLFGQDPSILNQDVQIGDRTRRIVGILPNDFVSPEYGISADFYLPSTLEAEPGRKIGGGMSAIGRLKRGTTVEQAEAELAAIAQGMASRRTNFQLVPWIISLNDKFRAYRTEPFQLLVGAAGLLFLIGCSAVANLTLGRTAARRKELGVHLALGGSRRQVCRLVWRETLILSLLGTVVGVGIACWAQRLLVPILPSGTPGVEQLAGFDLRAAGIAALLGAVICVLSGLVPAWRFSRISLNDALKEGTGSIGESRRLRGLRSTLVVAQSASAVVLLIVAGLLIQSVSRLQIIYVGYDPARLVAFIGQKRFITDRIDINQMGPALAERLSSLPEVSHAAITSHMPTVGFMAGGGRIEIPGRSDIDRIAIQAFAVSPGYFDAMGMRRISGSGFAELRPSDRPVVVIDEMTAQRYFPDENPVGRSIIRGDDHLEIVGVVEQALVSHPRHPRARSEAQLYEPYWQSSRALPWLIVLLRLSSEPGPNFEARVRKVAYDVDPTMVINLQWLEDAVADWSKTERSTLTVLQVLSALAVTLAFAGVFSVTAYMVAQRRGELGLRMVLGATPGNIAAFVLKRGAILGGLGIVLGIGLALGLTRFMTRLLYETKPHEPVTFVVVPALLALATALACWLPARRAAKIDPAITLRAE